MATAHLICGFIGAGKTTFSEMLATQQSAVRFSLDELYLQLFTDEPTRALDDRAMERLLRMLDSVWPSILVQGVDVVLDFGFWQRAFRDEVRERAGQVGAEVRLYWLRCPDDVALARCLGRNGSPGAFVITAQDFLELKAKFEPPTPDEIYEIIDSSSNVRLP